MRLLILFRLPHRFKVSLSFILIILLFSSCSSKKDSDQLSSSSQSLEDPKGSIEDNNTQIEGSDYVVSAADRTWDTVAFEVLRSQLPEFDFKQDISSLSVQELRFLRNTIPARYGYLFMHDDLRNYFYRTPWYKALMESRWYGDCKYSGLRPAPPITYTDEEIAFMDRVKKMEDSKLAQNYIIRDGFRYANVNNIVNAWQFESIPSKLLDGLDRNGFAIIPNNNVQFFHLYEQNDYSQVQNFVSTDMYLQLFHMHFSFMLRGLEEEQFVPILRELLNGLQEYSNVISTQEKDATIIDAINYNAAFYSIPLSILEEKNISLPEKYKKSVTAELANIKNQVTAFSLLLPSYTDNMFPYDLFKPRGHYTRTDILQRYFKAMQWLQTAPYCLKEETDFKRAMVAAFMLNNGKGKSGKSLTTLYKSILDPTSFLVGQPDNLSLLDICNILNSKNIKTLSDALKPETLNSVRKELASLQGKNMIKPKIELTCSDKINFMPSRFVLDNEILQEMTDTDRRPYPKGLDVLAAFGSVAAEGVLNERGQ
ncbi:MAG TPA: hypothetical protein DIW27_07905, partial [Cytophagales bacterium]|nr:hypothetical protein [Cytophagales bacterium]